MENAKRKPIIQPRELILVKKHGNEEFLRLKEIFASQLMRLEKYGYEKSIIDLLKAQEDLVIQAAIRISPDALIPFSPVIPRQFDTINAQLYEKTARRHPKTMESLADRPYYLISVISQSKPCYGYDPINMEEGMGIIMASGAMISVNTKNFMSSDKYDNLAIVTLMKENEAIRAITAQNSKNLTWCKGRM